MFEDLSFVLPIRLDSINRIENVISVVSFLKVNGFQNINIIESGSYKNGILERLLNDVNYCFIEDQDHVFHRTRFINEKVKSLDSPYLAIWDADVIISPLQILLSYKFLKAKEYDVVIPYENHFLDTSSFLRKLFLESKDIGFLEKNISKMKELYKPSPMGGAFMINMESYIECGMENEDFYGWGMEDGERFYRWQRMGCKIKRIQGPLFHLSHERGMNSMFHNPDQSIWKSKETLKSKRLISGDLFTKNSD